MFRTAALTAARVARPAVASAVRVARVARPAAFAQAVAVQKVAAFQAVRFYSAGGHLNKDEVFSRIAQVLSGFDKVNDPKNITQTAHFANDLGLDSLDTVEVVMAIEEEFSIEIPDKDADQIHSVDKAVEYILSQPDAN
ncbi:acyl carrier protein-like protein [Copromyces sp. CBS 386.78]|nr:acyl carrier protein-like protein [Copromyces sp. CBS 386.78]